MAVTVTNDGTTTTITLSASGDTASPQNIVDAGFAVLVGRFTITSASSILLKIATGAIYRDTGWNILLATDRVIQIDQGYGGGTWEKGIFRGEQTTFGGQISAPKWGTIGGGTNIFTGTASAGINPIIKWRNVCLESGASSNYQPLFVGRYANIEIDGLTFDCANQPGANCNVSAYSGQVFKNVNIIRSLLALGGDGQIIGLTHTPTNDNTEVRVFFSTNNYVLKNYAPIRFTEFWMRMGGVVVQNYIDDPVMPVGFDWPTKQKLYDGPATSDVRRTSTINIFDSQGNPIIGATVRVNSDTTELYKATQATNIFSQAIRFYQAKWTSNLASYRAPNSFSYTNILNFRVRKYGYTFVEISNIDTRESGLTVPVYMTAIPYLLSTTAVDAITGISLDFTNKVVINSQASNSASLISYFYRQLETTTNIDKTVDWTSVDGNDISFGTWDLVNNTNLTGTNFSTSSDVMNSSQITGNINATNIIYFALGASSNLFRFVQLQDNVNWLKTRCTVAANVAIGPDGRTTAEKLIEDTSNNSHYSYQQVSVTSGVTYTVSCYAKAAERSILVMQFHGANSSFTASWAFFDLSTGTTSIGSGSPTVQMEYVGNGWYRCAITSVATATASANIQPFGIATSTTSASYQGDGASGIFITGAQLEASSVAGPYIPTKSSAITFTSTGTLIGSATADVIYANGLANTQTLVATTSIMNLPRSGAISTAGSINFGTSTRILPTGNLTASNTAFAGTLTIETATAIDLTLTNCTGQVNLTVTGNGSVRVILGGSTPRTILSTTLPSGVTVVVACSVVDSTGASFNIVARYGTTGAYTDLGYQTSVTSASYLVDYGSPVELCMWRLGYLSFVRTIATTSGGFNLSAEMITEPDVNTALNVASYLSNITVTSTAGQFRASFNADMDVPDIEYTKAIVHRLLGLEASMRALLPPGTSSVLDIEPDEIQINQPAVFLDVGAGANRVLIRGFFNTSPAIAVNPNYVINPERQSDNRYVQLPLIKPALDTGQLALAVWQYTNRTLTADPGAAAHTATQALVTARPTLTQIEASTVLAKESTVSTRASQASVDTMSSINQAEHDATQSAISNIPTLANIEASAILAKESTLITKASQISVDSIPKTTLLSSDTRLDNLDAKISTRLDSVSAIVSGVWGNASRTITEDPGASGHIATQTAISNLATPLNASGTQAAVTSALTSYDAAKKTDVSFSGATLADIEASTILAKEATVLTRATQTSVNAIPTNTLLMTDVRLSNLDAKISTRLASVDYAATTPTDIQSATNSALVAYNAAKTGDAMKLTSEYDAAKTAATQISVNAIPTNTLLTTDSRLDNLDAKITTRLATSAYALPPTLSSIESAITSGFNTYSPAKPGDAMKLTSEYDAAKTAATQISVNAIPTNPVLTTDSRLNNLDTTVSSRLADVDYIQPDTASDMASAVWNNPTRTITVDPGASAHIATQTAISLIPTAQAIRQEIDINSIKLDANISSRLASVDYQPLTSAQIQTIVDTSIVSNDVATKQDVGDPIQKGDIVDSNITKVKGISIKGTGTVLDPWGPV